MKAAAEKDGWFFTTKGEQSHFRLREFECRDDCGRHHVAQELIDALDALRIQIMQPLIVTSGSRCPHHNSMIGGSTGSWHQYRAPGSPNFILGQDDQNGFSYAADVICRSMTPKQLLQVTKRPQFINLFTGRGLYPSWVHLDVRPGNRVEWRG